MRLSIHWYSKWSVTHPHTLTGIHFASIVLKKHHTQHLAHTTMKTGQWEEREWDKKQSFVQCPEMRGCFSARVCLCAYPANLAGSMLWVGGQGGGIVKETAREREWEKERRKSVWLTCSPSQFPGVSRDPRFVTHRIALTGWLAGWLRPQGQLRANNPSAAKPASQPDSQTASQPHSKDQQFELSVNTFSNTYSYYRLCILRWVGHYCVHCRSEGGTQGKHLCYEVLASSHHV